MNIFSYLPVAIFSLAVLCFLFISLVLVYHWRRYGPGDAKIKFFETAYFVVGIILLISAAGLVVK